MGVDGARARVRTVWWLLLLPMVASAAIRDLWAPDEPRYGEVAREIYSGGSFLVMHLGGQPYPDKPPLQFWLSGLFGWLFGWHELWLRLPSLLATLGTAWLVARLARRWWGEREATWAPAFFLANAMVSEIGGRLQIDPLLTLLCTLSLDLATRPAVEARRRRLDLVLAGLSLGLAALTKGPVAWVDVGLVLVAWRWLAPASVPPARRGDWVLFVALAVLPVAAWAGAASLAEPSIARDLFFGQHVGRITDVGERHPGPPWKHLEQMPLFLLPWTFLVATGIAGAWSELRRRLRREQPTDSGLLLALLWLVPLLLFFSAIPPKRELYLLPAYPAAALLAARPFALALERRALARWIALATATVIGVIGLGLSVAVPAIEFAARLAPRSRGVAATLASVHELPGLVWRGPVAGALLVAAAIAALLLWRRGNVRGWALALLGGWCACGLAMALVIFPPLDPLKSSRALAVEIAARPERPTVVPCLGGIQPGGFLFYGRVPAVRADDLRPALERDRANFLALTSEEGWRQIDPATRALVQVVISRKVGGKAVLVLGAAPPSAQGAASTK